MKSPKIYITDNGILHSLLNIRSFNQLLGHPVFGYSFEGLVIRNIMNIFRGFNYSFYKTSHGAEISLIMEGQGQRFAIEIKATNTPAMTRGFWNAQHDLKPDKTWIIAWIEKKSVLAENVYVTNLQDFCAELID